MVKTRMLSVIGVGFAVSVLAGCHLWPMMSDEDGRRPMAMGKNDQVLYPYNAQPVRLSEDFGQSFSAAREAQIINPQASQNLEPVTGLNGAAAGEAAGQYLKMFNQPPFGDAGGGGGGGN